MSEQSARINIGFILSGLQDHGVAKADEDQGQQDCHLPNIESKVEYNN